MSGMASTDTKRPWHGETNPMESLHDWMVAELAKVQSSPAVQALERKVAELEDKVASLTANRNAGGASPKTDPAPAPKANDKSSDKK
jgi:hypothetical protein